jgi:tyrosine-protein kinase Etk/Wzc
MNDGEKHDPARAGRTQAADETISLLDLLLVIVRHKRLIVIMTAVVALVTVGILMLSKYLPTGSTLNLLPNVYTPTAKILLQDATPSSSITSMLSQSGLGALSGLIGTSGIIGKANAADLAKALLSSRIIQDRIAEKFDFVHRYKITKYPITRARAKMISAMKITFDENSGIMKIGYRDTDPMLATEVANAVTDQLQTEFKRLTVDKTVSKRLYLEEAIATAEKEVAAQSAALIAFQNKYGIYDMNAQAQATISAVASQQALMVSKQVELQLQQKYLPPTDARIVRLKDEIASIQKLISQLTVGGTDLATGTVPQKQMPALGVQYLSLQRDLQVQQAILSMLKQQVETTKLEEMDTSKTFQIVEMAEVPEVRSGPARTTIAAISTVAAFFLAILVAFLMEYLARAKLDPVEAEKLSAIRASLAFWRKHSR